MRTYEICWSDGRRETAYTYGEALERVQDAIGTDGEIGHSGDLTDGGDRTLFWRCETDAQDDDGRRAAGSIVEVGS